MPKTPAIFKSYNAYLKMLKAKQYSELKPCFLSDLTFTIGDLQVNPTAYEIFSTHEHLNSVKEQVFRFTGSTFSAAIKSAAELADRIAKIWSNLLPELFPGYYFLIYREPALNQIAFFRKRTGVTEDSEEIKHFLAHYHQNIRYNALLAATIFPNNELVRELEKCLYDGDLNNIRQAVIALGKIGDEDTINLLISRFGRPGFAQIHYDYIAYDFYSSLIMLGNKGYTFALETLSNYKHLDSETTESLCDLLGQTEQDEVLDLLMTIYFDSNDNYQCALTGLLNIEKKAFDQIKNMIYSSHPEARKRAVWFLANTFITDARPYLLEGINDNNSDVREAAIFGIGRFKHPTRKKLLITALEDNSAKVRARALNALAMLHDHELLPIFQKMCSDKNSLVRSQAMRAIASLNIKRGITFLEDLFVSSSLSDKKKIICSLYAFTGHPSMLKQIIKKASKSCNRQIIKELKNLQEIIK